MTTYTANSLPPCPECGGPLTDESGTTDAGPYFFYECLDCAWGWTACGKMEPLTIASAPWTRDLWAEMERLSASNDRQAAHARSLSEALDNTFKDRDAAEQERDRLRAALVEVLACFTQYGHPGKDCQRTGWIDVETVTRWRSLLSPSGREGKADNEEQGR